jgi:hypothetical protein
VIYRGKVDWWVGAVCDQPAPVDVAAIARFVRGVRAYRALSPKDPVRFFEDIASHCPQLSWQGMDLVIALN